MNGMYHGFTVQAQKHFLSMAGLITVPWLIFLEETHGGDKVKIIGYFLKSIDYAGKFSKKSWMECQMRLNGGSNYE